MGGISVLFLLGIFMSMYLVFLVISFILIIYILFNYVFESVFLYNVSKKLKYKYPITSWIPFYNKCILGKIANKQVQGMALSVIDVLIIILVIISCSITTVPDVANTVIFYGIVILIFSSFVLNIFLSHNIIKKINYKIADILTLINVFTLGFSRAICLFVIRNNKKLINY